LQRAQNVHEKRCGDFVLDAKPPPVFAELFVALDHCFVHWAGIPGNFSPDGICKIGRILYPKKFISPELLNGYEKSNE